MDNLVIVIPFWNGHASLPALLASLPPDLPVIVVDDQSDAPLSIDRAGVRVVRPAGKGYFTGAVNAGLREAGRRDVLVLNQDVRFTGAAWLDLLEQRRAEYGLIGEGIKGQHPAWPMGYIHGTFMFIRRDVIDALGPMDAVHYPLWGSTCEYQLRACRRGFKALPLETVPDFVHDRQGSYGPAIAELLRREPGRRGQLIRTPPLVSVIIPAYNYGKYLPDAIHSLIGGPTCLGDVPGQTLQSFEVIVVDDGSTDDTQERMLGGPRWPQALADPWRGIHYIRQKNAGTPAANNTGIRAAHGKYVTILCADDMMEPSRLENLYRAAEANPHSVIYDDLVQIENGRRGHIWPMPDYDFETLLNKNHMHAGIFFPRQAWQEVGGYPEEMRYGREDWAFNVRLGIHGWCGVHVGPPGYLYRREGQNRILRNSGKDWRERFVNQLRLLFPDIYRGERPMACCGGGGRGKGASTRASRSTPALKSGVGVEGMVVLQYIGGNSGTEAWFGPETGQRYQFSSLRPVAFVDKRDAPGLIGKEAHGRRVFKRYVEPPKPASAKSIAKAIEKAVPGDTVFLEAGEYSADNISLPADVKLKSVPDVASLKVTDIRAMLGDLNSRQKTAMLDAERASDKPRASVLKMLAA